MGVTHKPKAGALLTGTEYEAADAHTVLGLAPDDADYLVGTASSGLSNEIAVGTTPGGELGGTWASPTVDATHSGSTHAGAASAAVTTHEGLSDPHTGYRLESADHSHASTGPQGGTVAHSVLTGISATDHHVAPAAGPDADVTVDTAGAAGTASTFARSGHGHKIATSSSAAAAIGTAASGTSGTAPSRGDHVHPTGAGTPSTQAFGDAAATGTGPAAAMTDHKHAMPANPIPGRQVVAAALGYNGPVATNNTTPLVGAAYLQPIQLNGPMLLRSLDAHMQAASSGTWQWGLFDPSSSATAATKLAGGTGTLNGTGIQVIAATSAPVTVPPGAYFLIVLAPGANSGSIYRVATVATVLAKSQAAYAWDDTPDLTTGWGTTTNFYQWFLHGDIDGSTQW